MTERPKFQPEIHTPFGQRAKELILKRLTAETREIGIRVMEAIDKAGVGGSKFIIQKDSMVSSCHTA